MKNRTTQISMLAGALLAGVVTLAAPASAAITNNTGVVSLMTNGGGAASNAGIVAAWGGNPILYGNLATNATITLLSGGYPFGGSVANLKDGLMLSSVDPVGGPYQLENTDNSATFDNGASPSQVKLVLDGTYNLTRIDLFTSYTWNRTGQKWEVFTSTNGGTTWSGTALASVNYLNEEIHTWQSRRVSVLGNAYSAAIASGVNALRFDIYDTSTNGGGADIAVFSEIALYSAATIDTAVVSLMNGGGASSNASIAAAWGGNPILVGNLATNATITLLSGGYPFGGSVANLKDGLMLSSVAPVGGPYQLDTTDNSATFDNGASPSQVRLVLDGTYDLAKIDVFTSYTWNRTGQKWDVFTSTDGGTTWSGTALASVDYLNEEIDPWQSRRVSVLGDDAFAAFASGVNALRFDIYDTSTNGGGADISVFSEIAVYGAYTWTGGSGNWSATNNWLNRSGTNGGLVRLSGAGGASTNNALTNVMGLNFQSGAGSYTVSGSNALTVGSSGINNSSTNLQTVSSDLTLGASASFSAASGALVLAGNTALGTNRLTFSNAAAAAMTNSGVISGSGPVVKTGAGTVTLSGNNTYSGGTTLSSGVLRLEHTTAAGTGRITQAGGSALQINTAGTVANAMSVSNITVLADATLSGNIALVSTQSVIRVEGSANATINGVIAAAPTSLSLSAAQSLSSLTSGLGSSYNPVVRGGENFVTSLGSINAVGRFAAGSTNLAAGAANPVGTQDARMIQSFRGANSTNYILGGTTTGSATFGLARYDYSNFGNVQTVANPFGTSLGMEGWDWVDDDTIITTIRGSGWANRLALIDITAGSGAANSFSASINTTNWNTNGYVTTAVADRIRNVQVGETYTGFAYYGNNASTNNTQFYALDLATGVSTLLGDIGTITTNASGTFGLWTVKEVGGFLYVSTTDNGIFVYNMNSATNIGALYTNYSDTQLNTVTGNDANSGYFGFDIAADSNRLLLGSSGPTYEVLPDPTAMTKTGTGTLTLSGATATAYSGMTTVSEGVLQLNKTPGVNAIAGNVTIASGATLLLSASDNVANTSVVTLSGGTIIRGAGASEVFGSLNLTAASSLDFGTGATGSMTFGTYEENTTPSALLTVQNFLPGNSFTFSNALFAADGSNIGSYFSFGTGYINSSIIDNGGGTFTITAIPEPSTYAAAAGLLALLLASARCRRAKTGARSQRVAMPS